MDARAPVTISDPVPADFGELCRTVEALHLPDGYRAEIIRGKIVVSPWSRAYYWRPVKSLRRQLEPHAPEGHDADTAPFLFVFPEAARAYGPDLFVADEAAFEHHSVRIPGEALSLVAQLTPVSAKDEDWSEKLAVYGRQVPVYLLVDMQAETVTVFWGPSGQGYRSRTTVPFGEKLRVPEPFGFELDTDGFAAPGEATAAGTAGTP
ncbi:Uma2 family endonuclease [Streptomyces lycii]|uniref:Uma2 family endonuclease n=1 Tax=Streptomyces lycii TaxID=2654337 RepID=A0ABQ7FMS4_9ACTN|nr:Uma2 family endonuclease [Streptomyces lycii]